MSMLDCIICTWNKGSIERGWISGSTWYTIDLIELKTSRGKRYTRYAVCVNGRWKSNQQLSLREARAEVRRLKDEAESARYYAMYI